MRFVKKLVVVMMVGLLSFGMMVLPNSNVQAEDNQITNIKANAKSSTGHEAKYAIDDNNSTYYLTPPKGSLKDHYRYIDLELDGLYDISKIEIFNNEGSYNHYQIYATETGTAFNKVAFKSDDNIATSAGDEYTFTQLKASTIRINLSYNSKQMEGNLAEVKLYGTKVSAATKDDSKINVKDFKDTEWATEYDKFESNQTYANEKTINEIYALVGRVIGEEWKDSFVFETRDDNKKGDDIFEIENGADGKIIIRGNNGVSLASGFNHYLRYYCKVDYNPLFASNLKMPATLPAVDEKIVKETEYDYRYALNFCTYSYTMAFWSWEEFEAFLDWGAMSGINTMLDIVGQEEVLRRTLAEFGYTDEEVKEYIVGPGYFAWFYMQNMTSFGGKLPNNWFENRVELGRQMHDRMQTFGITPVLGGFSGQIPRNFKDKFPDVQYLDQGGWAGTSYERPDMIRTYLNGGGRDYFSEMADEFYKAQKDIFGDITNMYGVDPFHEGGRMGDMNPTIVYETIQKKMMEHDEDAIWIIQEWSGSIASNTSKLKNLDKSHVVVLDLFSEVSPRNSALEAAETPWVWNMLHNFGGRMGLDGNPEKISQEIPKSYQNSKYMKGIGMTPEAIENSPMVYELLFDMTWTKDPIDYREWTQQYVERNYGGTNEEVEEAWNILLDTGYNKKEGYYQGAPESVFNSRPRTDFKSASTWGHSTINYDKAELERAAALLANNYEEFKDYPSYIYDLSDITRQVIANSGLEYYNAMMTAYNSKNLDQFKATSKKFLELMELQDKVLSTNSSFLVGPWIEKSRTMLEGADDWTNDLFEYNARTLITTWGSESESNGGLSDYSNRQWAGLTKDYYYPRWERFIGDTITALENNTTLPTKGSYNWFLQESEWSTKKTDEGNAYTTSPSNENLKDLSNLVLSDYTAASAKDLVSNIETKENIALGKNVTSSVATDPLFSTTNLTDGNRGTPWKALNNESQFSLTIDLEKASSVDGIEISFEQVPKEFPYSYTVEVFRDGAWKEVVSDSSGSIKTSNLAIDYKGIASQVRFTFETTDTTIIPEVYELQVYGVVDSAQDYKNIALGKPATGNSVPTTALTDGNSSTMWASSTGSFPANVVVDLGNEEYVEFVNLYFEKAGIRFQYIVEVEDGQGNKTTVQDMRTNTSDLNRMYKISVGQQVKKIHVTITGKAAGGSFPGVWAALAEIEAMQLKGQTIQAQNIAFGKPGKVINTKPYNTTKLTDGNLTGLENVGSDIFPTTFQVDLGSNEMIEEVKIYFEKPGIRFKFKVEVEDEQGNKKVILDMSDNLADLAGMYAIPAQAKGSKINVVIEGRAPGGSFYLASPAMTQIEAYAKPHNVSETATVTSNIDLSEAEKTALIDGDESTLVDLNGKKDGSEKEFTLTFDKAIDIFAYELNKVNGNAIQYKVEYIAEDDETNTWKMLDDKSANMKNTDKYIGEFKPVLTKQVRFTIANDAAVISGFNVYQYNVTTDLIAYVTSLKKTISSLTIGEYPGNYTVDAKAILDAAIVEAEKQAATSLNSKEVAKEIKELKGAYSTFLKSYVTISRSKLLSELTSVEALLKMDELKNNTTLKTAYDAAEVVYNTAKVTQKQLDDTVTTLSAAKVKAIETLDAKTQLKAKLVVATALADSAVVGDKPGNVTQATLDEFKASIATATTSMASANTAEEVAAVASALEVAVNKFSSKAIVVDKTELIATIATAKSLEEKLYSKDSWLTIQTALAAAENVVLDNDSSISEVATANTNLQAAIDSKITLDRSQLAQAIESIKNHKEFEYTKTSWQNLKAAIDSASTVFTTVSVNQSDLDVAKQNVEQATSGLVKLDRSKLKELIQVIQKMDGSDYGSDGWNNLIATFNEAVALMDQMSLEQVDIDDMLTALEEKVGALEVANTDDAMSELKEAIEKAKKYLTPDKYTYETYIVFKNAYDQAVALLAKRAVPTNSEIRKAITELNNGIDGLKEVSSDPKPSIKDQNKTANGGYSRTGDTTNVAVLMLLLIASGALTTVSKKRKNKID